MSKILDTIVGSLDEKRKYKKNEARAKALPKEYAEAYKEIKKYVFSTSGLLTMEPLKNIVHVLEEAAANDRRVVDVVGSDVAEFVDELVRDEKSYVQSQREKLNRDIAKTGKK